MKKMWNSSISIILSTAVVTVTGRGMERKIALLMIRQHDDGISPGIELTEAKLHYISVIRPA